MSDSRRDGVPCGNDALEFPTGNERKIEAAVRLQGIVARFHLKATERGKHDLGNWSIAGR